MNKTVLKAEAEESPAYLKHFIRELYLLATASLYDIPSGLALGHKIALTSKMRLPYPFIGPLYFNYFINVV